MKSIFIVIIMCLSINLFAQTKSEIRTEVQLQAQKTLLTDNINVQYDYCELLGTGNLLGTKVTVEMDFGQATQFMSDTRYRDAETGKVVKFNSMVDAMNFMGKNGWEFVQAYVVTTGNQHVYRWLLKRKSE